MQKHSTGPGALLEKGLEKMAATPGGVLVDVREEAEYAAGHLAGSVNLPLSRLAAADFPAGAALFVYCQAGARSAKACAALRRMGWRAENIGGVEGWAGPLVR